MRGDTAFLKRKRLRKVSAPVQTIRGADLFCGCGGLSIGVREACVNLEFTFDVVWAADTDAKALAVYRDNFSPTSSFEGKLESVLSGDLGEPATEQERALKAQLGALDLALAGPPCQGHSGLNNWTRHDDERNKLYTKVARFAEVLEPTHLLIENVPTVVVDRDGAIHRTVEHLLALGYSVDSRVVDFAKIGVPQRRRRHIVVASKTKEPRLAEWMKNHNVEERTVRWAIEDLETSKSNGFLNTPTNLSPENRRRIDYLFKHGKYDLPNNQRPKCHQDGKHSYKSMYGRLSWDKPAQTITTGFTSPGQGRFIHPGQRRTLTPREAARLQFFPDDFNFTEAKQRSTLARLIGNAVPPKLSWIIFQELLS